MYLPTFSRFHFTQAAKKRAMQTPQLYPYLYSHKDAREIYYKLLSLPLLHPRDIIPEFQKLKVIALAKHRAVFAEFIKYFERQWILKVSDYTCCFFFMVSSTCYEYSGRTGKDISFQPLDAHNRLFGSIQWHARKTNS